MGNTDNKLHLMLQFKLAKSLIAALLLFLSTALLQLAAAEAGIILSSLGFLPDDASFTLFVSVVSALLCMVWCGYCYCCLRTPEKDFSYRNAFAGWRFPAIAGMAIGGCIIFTILLSILQSYFPAWFRSYTNRTAVFTLGNQMVTVLYVLLVAPVSEELIFRGAILERVQRDFPFWLANVFQALLFGIYHTNLIQGLYAFALGLVLGLVRLSAGTVTASIAAHSLFNATSYVLQWMFPKGKQMSGEIVLLTFLVGVVSFCVGLWYTIFDYCKKDRSEELPS